MGGSKREDGKDAADAAAVFGLILPEEEDECEPVFAVTPDNVDALSWFLKMQTQWRVAPSGLMGLDYGLFLLWSKDEGVKRGDRVWLLEDLRLMEREYMEEVDRIRDERRDR